MAPIVSVREPQFTTFMPKAGVRGQSLPLLLHGGRAVRPSGKQEANKETTGYYGKYAVWRDRPMEDIQAQLAAGNPWVLRFRSEGSIDRQFKFDDLVKGKLTITENNVDHVLIKSDGIPTYHFAHAVDDHLMRTTHVVRGTSGCPVCPSTFSCFRRWASSCPSTSTSGR